MYCSTCGQQLASLPPTVCDACGTSHWLNPKPGSSALICSPDNSLLLIRRANEPWKGYWDVPGGFCEAGEHPRDTAKREAREEAGMDIEITSLFGRWMDRYPSNRLDLPDEHVLAIYYCARVAGGDTSDPDPGEVSEIRWFDQHALPQLVAFPGHLPQVLDRWRDAKEAMK